MTWSLQTAPPVQNVDVLPSIVIDTPEGEFEEDRFIASISCNGENSEIDGEIRSFNKLAPDDAFSNGGSR